MIPIRIKSKFKKRTGTICQLRIQKAYYYNYFFIISGMKISNCNLDTANIFFLTKSQKL
jgi:hypothetical protein